MVNFTGRKYLELWRRLGNLGPRKRFGVMGVAVWGPLFLDVSKCYESVAHTLAGNRAIDTGCHPRITNLVMSMYQGTRRLLVDGAISQPLRGHSGLMAGCSFARDFLKAFLSPLTEGWGEQLEIMLTTWWL